MNDREKVISALKNCLDVPTCRDCPWEDCETFDHRDVFAPASLLAAALELLKEQEPRVLTLDEVKHLISLRDGGVWLETGACGRGQALFPALPEFETKGLSWFVNIPARGYRSYFDNDYYNKTWRVWTAKPTNEQRKAAGWE